MMDKAWSNDMALFKNIYCLKSEQAYNLDLGVQEF